jgi:hypothetical protein
MYVPKNDMRANDAKKSETMMSRTVKRTNCGRERKIDEKGRDGGWTDGMQKEVGGIS